MEAIIHGQDPSQAPGAVNVATVDSAGNLRVAAGTSIPVNTYIWNPETLDWEAATGSGGSGGSSPAATAATWKVSDMDTAGDPQYFGYLDGTGAWHILRLGTASGQARYAKGTTEYAANWANRAGLSYDHYNNVF